MISQKSNKIADGCRFCWMCRHICPTGIATGREEFTPRARGLAVSMMARGMEYDQDLAEAIFACALCGCCSNDCVTGYEPPVFIREARTEAVVQDLLPPAVAAVVERALEGGDVVTKCCCADDTELLAKIAAAPAKAEVAVVLGETACNHRPETAVAFLNVLEKAGVAYCVVDKKVGGELFDLIGYVDEVKAQADAFAAAVAETGAKTVVVSDAEVYRTLKADIPKALNIATADLGFEIKHIMELVAPAIEEGTLKLTTPVEERMAYHDASSVSRTCDDWTPYKGERGWMGMVYPGMRRRRGRQGLYAQPRAIMAAVPGADVTEFIRIRENAFDVCAGRGVDIAFPALTEFATKHRIDEAKELGIETIVAADAAVKNAINQFAGDGVKAIDITELIVAAL